MKDLHNKLIKKSDVDINLAYLDTKDFKPYLESTRDNLPLFRKRDLEIV